MLGCPHPLPNGDSVEAGDGGLCVGVAVAVAVSDDDARKHPTSRIEYSTTTSRNRAIGRTDVGLPHLEIVQRRMGDAV